MGKFLIGLITGVILTGLTLFILLFAVFPFREKASRYMACRDPVPTIAYFTSRAEARDRRRP